MAQRQEDSIIGVDDDNKGVDDDNGFFVDDVIFDADKVDDVRDTSDDTLGPPPLVAPTFSVVVAELKAEISTGSRFPSFPSTR